jgi:hypothetical protein
MRTTLVIALFRQYGSYYGVFFALEYKHSIDVRTLSLAIARALVAK